MPQEKLQAQLLHLQWLAHMLAVSMNSSAEKWQSLSEGLDHLDQMLNPPKFDIDKACDAAMARVQAQIDASCLVHSHAIACRFAAVKQEMAHEANIWQKAAADLCYYSQRSYSDLKDYTLEDHVRWVRIHKMPAYGEN